MNGLGDTARVAFPLDVKDTNEAYEISAVLPGVSADDLNIQITNDTLTIQGEVKVEQDDQATYLLRERTPDGLCAAYSCRKPSTQPR